MYIGYRLFWHQSGRVIFAAISGSALVISAFRRFTGASADSGNCHRCSQYSRIDPHTAGKFARRITETICGNRARKRAGAAAIVIEISRAHRHYSADKYYWMGITGDHFRFDHYRSSTRIAHHRTITFAIPAQPGYVPGGGHYHDNEFAHGYRNVDFGPVVDMDRPTHSPGSSRERINEMLVILRF